MLRESKQQVPFCAILNKYVYMSHFVLTLKFEPKFTVQETRKLTYSYIHNSNLYFLAMKSIFEKFKRDKHAAGSNSFPLIELPDLVILEVAKHLTTNDGRNLKMTCQRFKV